MLYASTLGGGAAAPAQSLAIRTPGISASPLLAEFTSPDGAHGNALVPPSGKSTTTERPFDRIIKAVSSLTPAALRDAVSDIGSVISMNDRIAGSAPGNGSRVAVGEDLVAMTNCRLQARNFITQDGANGTRRMKSSTNATPLNVASSTGSVNDSFKQLWRLLIWNQLQHLISRSQGLRLIMPSWKKLGRLINDLLTQ
ncbi:hypothetical protein RYX36_018112 [Vicia faba]